MHFLERALMANSLVNQFVGKTDSSCPPDLHAVAVPAAVTVVGQVVPVGHA